MQLGFLFDQTRCSGCFTCLIACKEWHDSELGPVDYRDLAYIERGKYPQPYVAYLTLSCLHCADPACATACPVNAISKRPEDGIVMVDREVCTGNKACPGFCVDACPYHMARFGDEENAKMQKCDLCLSRLAEQKPPVCVNACPSMALEVGPLRDLLAVEGRGQQAEGFLYSDKVKPSIAFKAKTK